MNDTIVNYYELPENEPNMAELRQTFKSNISKHNVPFFDANSEAERTFLDFCHNLNIALHKKTIIEYHGKSTCDNKLLFLCLKDDDGMCISENERDFIDTSIACHGGGGGGSCGRGARQVGNVFVKPEGIQPVISFGLLATRYPYLPRVLLASALVGRALRKAGATGCEIAATNDPNCFQLRITAETIEPTQTGQIRMGKRCPLCGTAKLFFGSCERYFRNGGLKATDFQICRKYAADNGTQFEILNGFPIVSQRIFDLLLKLNVKGLDWYSSDPPVQHAVVQIHD